MDVANLSRPVSLFPRELLRLLLVFFIFYLHLIIIIIIVRLFCLFSLSPYIFLYLDYIYFSFFWHTDIKITSTYILVSHEQRAECSGRLSN